MNKVLLIFALCSVCLAQNFCPWWLRWLCTPEQPEPPAPTPDPLTVLWNTNYGKIGMTLQCLNGPMAILHGVSSFTILFFFSAIMLTLSGFHVGAFLFSVPYVGSELLYIYESIQGMMTYCTGIFVARYGSTE